MNTLNTKIFRFCKFFHSSRYNMKPHSININTSILHYKRNVYSQVLAQVNSAIGILNHIPGSLEDLHHHKCAKCMSSRAATSKIPKSMSNEGAERKEFQAETKVLLEIVAKSLYSDREVFIRELISNASDALEKLRYLQVAEGINPKPLEIKITTNKPDNLLIIEDTGIGMTRDELINNLGTIAKSGSKAFLEEMKRKGGANDISSVIGKFGVGFYSVFMVSNKVEVITKSYKDDAVPCRWSSDGKGTYEIEDIDDTITGMKIIIHLKPESREFADEGKVKDTIKRYSNFINAPIFVNGIQINTVEPLWVKEPKSVTQEAHNEFYKLISNCYDKPRFTLHFKTEIPLSVHALIYIPEGKPGLFELNRDGATGVALYAKRVLIKNEADDIIPKWLRFARGIVDCEDIPLNVSRELLQNSPITSKLRSLVTNKILRFLYLKSTLEASSYKEFYKEYSIFLKEGLLAIPNIQNEKEEIAKLFFYESSHEPTGTTVSLIEYCSRAEQGQKKIFYLAAPSRHLAENSPYLEGLKQKNVEVLFCYESYDEYVLMNLKSFNDFQLVSVESEIRKMTGNEDLIYGLGENVLTESDAKHLVSWLENKFRNTIHTVQVTGKLDKHPCIITVEEMAAARHFIRTQPQVLNNDIKYSVLKPKLEINLRHPIITKLSKLVTTNTELASLVAEQLISNALVTAGLLEDPRTALLNVNKLLELALKDH